MIASGEKKEEYREIKPHWIQRLTWHEYHDWSAEDLIRAYEANPNDICRKDYDVAALKNGYGASSPILYIEPEQITIGEGKPEWGAEPGKKYFVIKLDFLP